MKRIKLQPRARGLAAFLSILGTTNVVVCTYILLFMVGIDAAGCDGKFGPFIEGAAVNKQGEVFAVNARNQRNTIGRISGDCGLFATGERV
jgi:hypothetical protein